MISKKFEGKRFIIRDKETKKTKYRNGKKMEFDSINSARTLYLNINFGLENYYEIYDKHKEEVCKI